MLKNRLREPALMQLRSTAMARCVLREQEAGAKAADLYRKYGMSEATLYNWKAKYGGLEVSEAKRLRALEYETPG